MVRELAISIFLLVFRILFNICKLFSKKKKTVFVTSFGDNALYTMNELEKQTDEHVVVLKTSQCRIDFMQNTGRTVLLFDPAKPLQWFCSVYHLATSRIIFTDNYFGFFAVANFKQGVKCIQLWHAAGAIKQFGLKDPANKARSTRAIKRFHQVYNRFDHVVVGSEKMAAIFKESFGLANEHMLRTGIPRTDFFFDKSSREVALQKLDQTFPLIKDRIVILYAPTFRDDSLDSAKVSLDINQLYYEFKEDHVLFLRLHPAIRDAFVNPYPDFVIDVSSYPDIHHLLIRTDCLITDYSSIPFEFSLLNRPMIFFAYDLNEYSESRGFWENYEMLVPGPVVKNTEELIEALKEKQFEYERIEYFAFEWNEYSDGASSKRLIEHIYK